MSQTEQLEMIVDAAVDIFRNDCPPELVAQAEAGEGWSPELWAVLEESGLAAIGLEGSRPEALAVVRAAARFAAPVPLAETVLAQLFDPSAGPGPLSVGAGRRAAYGRFARRVVGVDGEIRLTPGVNYAGEPWDLVEPSGLSPLLPLGALVRTVQMAGALETVLELSATYAEERKQFGQPLSRFQAIQHYLALIAEEVEAARAAADAAIATGDDMVIALAKIRCGESVAAAAPLAHQIHGAIGFTDEHRLQQYTRRLWAWRDDFGTESEWALWAGSRLDPGRLWEVTLQA